MAGVLGIGGFFYRSADPEAARAWYARVLGFEFTKWGGAEFDPVALAAKPGATTVWNAFDPASTYFDPSPRDVMINLVVDDLDAVLARVEAEGVAVLSRTAQDPYGKFAQILDPDGLKIELWEPPAKAG